MEFLWYRDGRGGFKTQEWDEDRFGCFGSLVAGFYSTPDTSLFFLPDLVFLLVC